jgi:hypothetical protein
VCTSGTIGRSSRTSKGESIHSSWISYLWRASANGLPRAAINPKGGCRVALSRKGPRDRSSLGVPHYDFPRLSGQGAAKRRKACRAWPGATSSWDEGKGDERGGGWVETRRIPEITRVALGFSHADIARISSRNWRQPIFTDYCCGEVDVLRRISSSSSSSALYEGHGWVTTVSR